MTEENTMSLLPDLPLEVTPVEVELEDLPGNEWLGIQEPKAALIYSINSIGLMQPPILSPDPLREGKWIVRAGRRRIKACRIVAADDPTRSRIRAWVVEGGTADQLIALEEALNATAEPNRVEQFLHFETLMNRGYSIQQIASEIGVPQGTVKARLRLANLNPVLRQAMLNGLITPSNAEEAAKLKEKAQDRLATTLTYKGKLTAADVAEVKRTRHEEAVKTTFAELDFGDLAGIEDVESAEKSERETLKTGVEVLRSIIKHQKFPDNHLAGLEAVLALAEKEER